MSTTINGIGAVPLAIADGGTNTTTSTGTGNLVFSNSPTFDAATIGAATGTSLTFSPTTNGIVGTTAADNAASGDVGQYISSNVPYASAVSPASSVVNVTSILLSAGDWDLTGNVYGFSTSSPSTLRASISATSATNNDKSQEASYGSPGSPTYLAQTLPALRASVSGNTTYYLCGSLSSSGTSSLCGNIQARRRR